MQFLAAIGRLLLSFLETVGKLSTFVGLALYHDEADVAAFAELARGLP